MITPQTIQTITSRIDIIDVVGEFVKLKKRGANYLGLCPFMARKRPLLPYRPPKRSINALAAVAATIPSRFNGA